MTPAPPPQDVSDPPVTILFVDDDPAVLRVLQRSLLGQPFDVITAASGAEALRTLKRRRVDVLVADLDMPGMSGLELLSVVRKCFPSVLRALLTGTATLERTVEAINEGEIVRLFPKPFDGEALGRALQDLAPQITRARSEVHGIAEEARREHLVRWVEVYFPGATRFNRDESGRLVIHLNNAIAAADAMGSSAVRVLLARR